MKIAIFGGGGGVGSSVAYNLCLRLQDAEVVLIDVNEALAKSHAMDLCDALVLGRGSRVRAGEASDAEDADIVIISAGVALHSMPSRNAFLDANAAIVANVADPLATAGWQGTMIIMTNPVDALVAWVQRRTGFDRLRVIGYSLNDTLRFRMAIADGIGAEAESVEAWVLGEHGGLHVPLFNRIVVDGGAVVLTPEQTAAAADYLEGWFARHAELGVSRSSTWTSGAGCAKLICAIADERFQTLPGSVVLEGEYGITGTAVSVPLAFTADGQIEIVEWSITDEESVALQQAAQRVRRTVAQVGGAQAISGWRLG